MTPPRFPYAVAEMIALAIISLAPMAPASAALSHTATIQRSFNVLKHLPKGTTSFIRVQKLVDRLVTFDPRHFVRYFRIGITKLGNPNGEFTSDVAKLQLGVDNLLKKSGLPETTVMRLWARLYPNIGSNPTIANPLPPPPDTP